MPVLAVVPSGRTNPPRPVPRDESRPGPYAWCRSLIEGCSTLRSWPPRRIVRASDDSCNNAIDRALEQLRTTTRDDLLTARTVGRAGLPTTTLGLLFHAAEHSTRHAGQAISTAKILAGS